MLALVRTVEFVACTPLGEVHFETDHFATIVRSDYTTVEKRELNPAFQRSEREAAQVILLCPSASLTCTRLPPWVLCYPIIG